MVTRKELELKKIRPVSSECHRQSHEDCPLTESESNKNTFVNYNIKNIVEQSESEEVQPWTMNQDIQLVKKYPFYTLIDLAKELRRSPEEVRSRFRYLRQMYGLQPEVIQHDL